MLLSLALSASWSHFLGSNMTHFNGSKQAHELFLAFNPQTMLDFLHPVQDPIKNSVDMVTDNLGALVPQLNRSHL